MVEHSVAYKNYDFIKVIPGKLWASQNPLWILKDKIFSIVDHGDYREIWYNSRHSVDVKESAEDIMSQLEYAKERIGTRIQFQATG